MHGIEHNKSKISSYSHGHFQTLTALNITATMYEQEVSTLNTGIPSAVDKLNNETWEIENRANNAFGISNEAAKNATRIFNDAQNMMQVLRNYRAKTEGILDAISF